MLHLITSSVPHISLLDIFARGGGGGSGSGDGDIVSIIALIGYFPAYYVSKFCNRLNLPKVVGYVTGGLAGTLVAIPLAFLSGGIGFIVFVGGAVGAWSGMNDLHARLRHNAKKSQAAMAVAASSDPAWQEAAIQTRIGQVFTAFQEDWSNFNTQRMQTYTTPVYLRHTYLMMKAIGQMNRQNLVGEPRLIQAIITDLQDHKSNEHDTFTTYIQAQANDQLIDRGDGKVIYADTSPFEEYWTFVRQGSDWVLSDIRQVSESLHMRDASLEAFAASNNMFYSPDWGWLLLPQRGQLFGKASFKNSDVNNHVIGEWQDLLVQLYTFVPAKTDSTQNYLIGQITLPKSYGGIIIKRRTFFDVITHAPKGYKKMSFEWPDFNKRYLVYATDVDQVTSFELLNPAFMAELYDMDLKVSIEVVDNVTYFYSKASNKDRRYEDMMKILVRAWRELKK